MQSADDEMWSVFICSEYNTKKNVKGWEHKQ